MTTPERERFWRLVHAEWTKFRTVRGWVIAMGITILAIAAFTFVGTNVSGGCTGESGHASGGSGTPTCSVQPTGPGGEPVQDQFYFAHQPVTGNGTITAQLTSLTGAASLGRGQPDTPDLQP